MTVADVTPLVLLAVVHLFAAMSPGATFLVISRQALVSGRGPAVAGALACGFGALPWAFAALVGLALVFQQAQWLYGVLKALGGLYLIYLAVMVWRHADAPVAMVDAGQGATATQAFREAFLTQIANPKVAVFFASIFVSVVPANPSVLLLGVILINVFLVEAIWYLLVAVFFSGRAPRAAYLKAKPAVDRVMALLLGALGVKLLADARS
jgi:threonine/homoserine/homoserine lactone efflux protein